MTAAQYQACTDWLESTPVRMRFFRILFRMLPAGIGFFYLLTGILLLWQRHPVAIRFLAVPAAVFLLTTFLRGLLDFPRPYDSLSYAPFLPCERGKGKSFPSRHAASAAAIACAFWQILPSLGVVFSLLAAAVAVSRVLGGLHYIRDVLVGTGLPLLLLPCYFF